MRGEGENDSRSRARMQVMDAERARPETVPATKRKERYENSDCGIGRRHWRLCHKPPFSAHRFWPDKKCGPIVS